MTKRLILLGPLVSLTILLVASPGWSESKLLEISLARNIKNRTPVKPYSPLVSCEKDRNRDIRLPVINAATDNQVAFWNRVTTKSPITFHHTWHKKNSGGWKDIANISLKVRKSSSFRTWSTKTIRPHLHIGEWMIVVSVDNNPKNVLCIVRFIVK